MLDAYGTASVIDNAKSAPLHSVESTRGARDTGPQLALAPIRLGTFPM